MSTSQTQAGYRCDWDNCPTHERVNVNGADMLSVIFGKRILYFYATDCLAFWAGSFPVGWVAVGDPTEEKE